MTAETVKILNPDGPAQPRTARAPTSAAAKNSGPRSHPSLPGPSLGFYASMLLCLTWPPGSSYSNDLTVRMEPSCAPAVKSYDAAKNAR